MKELTKCIGIISYFPSEEPKRSNRIKAFKKLLFDLNTYFKLPIIIIAQNWTDEDLNLGYNYGLTIYRYNKGLGITRARYELRKQLLKNHDFDYYIMLDDDSDLILTREGVDRYFKEIDAHPNMIGGFKSIWLRLLAISNKMLKLASWDYLVINNLDPCKGDIWEDSVWYNTYSTIYPNSFFRFTVDDKINEVFIRSEHDPNSTWYHNNYRNLCKKSDMITNLWIRELRGNK